MQAETTDRDAVIAFSLGFAEKLHAHLNAEKKKQLLAYLSDTREIVFSADILKTFCEATGIRNAMTSYDYIQRNDYEADLDTKVQLLRIRRN